MKIISARSFFLRRYPWAMAAGLVLAAAFPRPNLAGFGWIAPALILATALGTSGGHSFRLGYVAGLVHYLVSLYWLLLIPYRWLGLPLAPALGWLTLSAFLALLPATWVWLAIRISGVSGEGTGARGQVSGVRSGTPGEDESSSLIGRTQRISCPGWSRRMIRALLCAAVWVALEMFVARVFGGFPWNLLGTSQYRIVPLIQLASVTGVYGVSFVLVWTSVSLLNAVLAILHRPTWRGVWIADILPPGIVVFALFVAGYQHLSRLPEPERSLKVTLVQPSIAQTLIWDSTRDMERFQELVQLSEQALTNATDLLIWPEAGVPGLPRYQNDIAVPIAELARKHRVWMILGANDAEVTESATNFFNASLLINPEGKLAGIYRKRSLVIFGEYVPLVRWLPFLQWFTPADGGFTPGKAPVPFALEGWGERPREPQPANGGSPSTAPRQKAKTSVLICFEDVFPQLAREAVEPDTDFLVNLTNDGWFGESAAQWQQTAAAVFRAVENGLPLVRCANNGLTCWADAGGRLREILADRNGSVYGAGFMTVEIPLISSHERGEPTFYHRHGDWFGWGCVGVALLTLAWTSGARRHHQIQEDA